MTTAANTGTRINLLVERKNRGLSQQAMADLVGVTKRVWAKAENGSEPRGENAQIIARFFDVEIVEIWSVGAAA